MKGYTMEFILNHAQTIIEICCVGIWITVVATVIVLVARDNSDDTNNNSTTERKDS